MGEEELKHREIVKNVATGKDVGRKVKYDPIDKILVIVDNESKRPIKDKSKSNKIREITAEDSTLG